MSISNQHSIDAEKQAQQLAVYLHLSQLAGIVIPLVGWIAPIVIWQTKKAEYPSIDAHGTVVANWIVSELIYGVVCLVLAFVVIGLPMALVLSVLGVAFPIIGAVKAGRGEVWRYPLSFNFF